ncbi:hypothetical protein [Halarcobacter ebronensis]|uniref:Uncharacterized protein n=1 Tax=Halarcobacter ebronensis TaxID=1462615 RepID=A0A4Q1AJ77_9BACT|nr:hypothetical protein [Halarcobacter ebronensis]QKF82046.1 hypothetical protein AEBR_1563 [Halarcobacter ebronensis]RXK04120.1 hypothetical protein CRV07_11885 [Halarcobacter ebronensis]
MKKGYITEKSSKMKDERLKVNYLEVHLYLNGTYNQIEEYYLSFYEELPKFSMFDDRPKIKEKLEEAFKNKR